MKDKINCLLCGVGGQGTVLASRMIAAAAMKRGLFAETAETIGMAQRGGSVVSHVSVGENQYSPLIPYGKADIIIGFEPAEAVRCLPYLKNGGTGVVSSKAVLPVTASLGMGSYSGSEDMLGYLDNKTENLIVVDTDEICKRLGSAKVMNMVLLGAAASSGALGITLDELESAMAERLDERFHELNKKALRAAEQE